MFQNVFCLFFMLNMFETCYSFSTAPCAEHVFQYHKCTMITKKTSILLYLPRLSPLRNSRTASLPLTSGSPQCTGPGQSWVRQPRSIHSPRGQGQAGQGHI